MISATDRRAQIVAERIQQTGIDEVMIERLVRTFYGRIREHVVLGPIFNEKIDDWELHMQRLCAFWSSVMLASGAYGGTPMQKHVGLPIDGRHFDLWLGLFRETAADICPAAQAALFVDRAESIAESLEIGIATGSGVILAKGERLVRQDLSLADETTGV